MAKVTFDYAKAKGFISDDEIQIMKKLAEDAKQTLVSLCSTCKILTELLQKFPITL